MVHDVAPLLARQIECLQIQTLHQYPELALKHNAESQKGSSVQLLRFASGPNSSPLSSVPTRGVGLGLGDRPLSGESVSVGNGMLAATVISPKSARVIPPMGASGASSYCGLGSRECIGLIPAVGFRSNRSELPRRR